MRKRRWSEACLYCKGYPGFDKCFCSLGHRFWRLRWRIKRKLFRKKYNYGV